MPSKRRVRGEVDAWTCELLRLWRTAPAGKRREVYDKVFRLAETDPRQREELIELFDYFVMNAPRPRGRKRALNLAQMDAFITHVSSCVRRQGRTARSAVKEFAAERNLSESTLMRLWETRPELERDRVLEKVVRWLIEAGVPFKPIQK